MVKGLKLLTRLVKLFLLVPVDPVNYLGICGLVLAFSFEWGLDSLAGKPLSGAVLNATKLLIVGLQLALLEASGVPWLVWLCEWVEMEF